MFRLFVSLFSALALGVCAAIAVQPVAASAQTPSPSTRFLKAVTDRDGTTATQMLTFGADGLIDSHGGDLDETALHIATRRGDATWIRFLIDKRATRDVLDKEGNSPLMIAVLNDDDETARLLLQRGASVDFLNSRGESALIKAVQLRKPMLVRLLIANHADPERADYVAGLSARDYAMRDARSTVLIDALTPRAKPTDDGMPTGPFLTPGD